MIVTRSTTKPAQSLPPYAPLTSKISPAMSTMRLHGDTQSSRKEVCAASFHSHLLPHQTENPSSYSPGSTYNDYLFSIFPTSPRPAPPRPTSPALLMNAIVPKAPVPAAVLAKTILAPLAAAARTSMAASAMMRPSPHPRVGGPQRTFARTPPAAT